MCPTVSALPPEAEKLLAVAPDEFVAERQRLARGLRDAGRSDDAAAVSRLPKPSPVVLAVNRAARARPKAARAAADAAVRIKQTQLGGDPEALRGAIGDLESALELLADVAVAHVAPRGKRPSDAMRRRVRDLLRNAVADDEARDALARGVLTAETETPGFAPFAGVAPAPARGGRGAASEPAAKREEKRRERERALRAELAQAERDLNEAERSVHDAERKRAQAERAVTALRAKLERL
jgi:hypothetical protein